MDLVANGRYIPNVQSIESETWRGGTRILRTERRNLMEQFDAQGRANFFFTPRLKTSLIRYLGQIGIRLGVGFVPICPMRNSDNAIWIVCKEGMP